MTKHIREVQNNGLLWVNITKQGEKELNEVGKRFGFQKGDLLECMPPFQRPKMIKRPEYYFLIFHFPVFDRVTRRLSFTEVDIFISANYLVTVHDSKLPVIEDFFGQCKKGERVGEYFNGTVAGVFFELLIRLLDSVFPILLHINEDINSVDKKLFGHSPEREIAAEILRLKTNIVTFRRTMQGHRTVLERLLMNGSKAMQLVTYQQHIHAVREYVSEIWHMLESQKESINALHETNESIINGRTTEVMKIFTIISVLTFPLTLFVTILAIRAPGTPFVDLPGGFWLIFGFNIFGALMMLAIFRKKGWM